MAIQSSRNNKSKLVAALRRRFGNPAAVLRALGLDESLVDVGNTAQPDAANARVADFKVELSQWLSDHAASLPEVAGGGLVGKILALLDDDGAQDVGPDVDGFKRLMRGAGMTEADIEKAIELARGSPEAQDYLPANGLSGGLGGRLSGARAMDSKIREVREAELDHLVGDGFSRITVGPDVGRGRPRPAPMPSAKAVRSFEELYGADAKRIGV